MLSRSHRLSVGQFDTVMKKGASGHSPFFVVRYIKSLKSSTSSLISSPEEASIPSPKLISGVRVAAVASKKVASTAAVRNRIRRRIYAAVQPLMSRLSSPTHAIVFAKSDLSKAEISDLTKDLEAVFVKLGLLR